MAETPVPGGIQRSEELCAITARWFDAIRRRDYETDLARFSWMQGLSVWGTIAGEYIDDPELLRRYTRRDFEEGGFEGWEFGPLRIDAWVEGTVGWSLTHSTISSSTGPLDFRSTLIFHLEQDEWKIVHEHWSYGASDETYGMPAGRMLDVLSRAASEERPDLTAWTSDEGTTTLAFTDIEGSTALNASFGDAAWLEVLRVHNRLVTSATVEHGGTVVKNQGDGFMLAFPSARRALACAQAIEQWIADTFDDPGSPIRVRIGVHTGEVASADDDFFGHAVNYAARVAGAAKGGEILVSAVVHDLVSPTGLFTFSDPREVELKGITGVSRLYALSPP
ncbi:MAG: adenylate/guanylate cyclase domain-containing protein [Gaiellales bacterium]